MATSSTITTGESDQYKSRVLTGDLPEGFLQLDENRTTHGSTGMVQPLHQQYPSNVPMQLVKRLSVTVIQAKLAKNYGLTRMDPYCRLRVGHHVFETPTAAKGAINPRWNKTVTCPVMQGVNSVYIEIYDECSFSADSQIAWGLVKVSDDVLNGETSDNWYPLSGKQGQDKEGMINIILSSRETTEPIPTAPVMIFPQGYTTVPHQMYFPPSPMPYVVPQQAPPYQQGHPPPHQQGHPPPHQQGHPPHPVPAPVQIPEKDIQNIKDMFPDMDEEVIRSVLEASGGNVDAALNHLLSMNEK